MPMKNPPHPGGFVLRQCIAPLGLTITDAAAALRVTRTTLSELVNGSAEFPLKWPCACPRSSEAAPKAGSRSRRSTTLPRSAPIASSSGGWQWLSRFGASSFARGPLSSALFNDQGKIKRPRLPDLAGVNPTGTPGSALADLRLLQAANMTHNWTDGDRSTVSGQIPSGRLWLGHGPSRKGWIL